MKGRNAVPHIAWQIGSDIAAQFDLALSTSTSPATSDTARLHVLNRKTGNRIFSEYVDAETGKPVEEEDDQDQIIHVIMVLPIYVRRFLLPRSQCLAVGDLAGRIR